MAADVVAAVKPRLRGWIHAGMAPLALAGSIVLVVLAPTTAGKASTAVFGVTAILLFGTSAIYHRFNWSPRPLAVLRRLDHTNIFLIIAGTYTPLAVLLLPSPTARTLLIVVWSGAIAGVLARVFWLGAPRWFYTPIYVALGWVALWFLDDFWHTDLTPLRPDDRVVRRPPAGWPTRSARWCTAPSGPTRAPGGSGSTRSSTR